jgi:hypothetical protein
MIPGPVEGIMEFWPRLNIIPMPGLRGYFDGPGSSSRTG